MTLPAEPELAALVRLVSNLLALDQASKTSGWAVFIDGKLKTWGHFTMEQDDMGERLNKIRAKVVDLLEEYSIDEVAYEDIQLQSNVGNNVHTFKVLAEVYGILTELFYSYKIPAKSYLASVWKSQLNIKGRDRAAQKRAAQAYVMDTFKIKCTQDEADAICIGASVLSLNKKEPFDWS